MTAAADEPVPYPPGPPDPPSPAATLHDLSELQQAQQALLRSQADLRRLAAAQDLVQQNERRRIARELHDELQQTLASMRLQLASVSARLAVNPPDAAGAAALLPDVSQLALTAMAATRRIVNDLRPPILEDLGLMPALEALAARFEQGQRIPCRFVASGDWDGEPAPAPAVAHGLYRVAQEALTNVSLHAGAQQVTLELQRDAAGRILLRISDDGGGIASHDWRKPGSVGLLGMYERMRAIGGDLRVESAHRAGTTVEAELATDAGPANAPDAPERRPGEDPYADLLAFLYRAPVGLVQAGIDGRIELINPMAAQLLMPLAQGGRLDNLFSALQQVAPQLRTQSQALVAASGVVCDGLRLAPPAGLPPGARTSDVLLSLLKQDGARLMAVLSAAPARG